MHDNTWHKGSHHIKSVNKSLALKLEAGQAEGNHCAQYSRYDAGKYYNKNSIYKSSEQISLYHYSCIIAEILKVFWKLHAARGEIFNFRFKGSQKNTDQRINDNKCHKDQYDVFQDSYTVFFYFITHMYSHSPP